MGAEILAPRTELGDAASVLRMPNVDMEYATQARNPNAVQLNDTTGDIAARQTGFKNEVVPTFPVGVVITMDEKDARTDPRQVGEFNIQGPFQIKITKKDCVCWTMIAERIANRPKIAVWVAKKGDAVCLLLS
jgi:hypothetical protein